MHPQPIQLETVLDVPIKKVWKALTDRDRMKYWYYNLPNFKAEVGFKFQFYGGKDENIQYLHLCEVLEVHKPVKLAYSWCYAGYYGDSVVTFELLDMGSKTRLLLTHSGIENFKRKNSDFIKTEFKEGWSYIMDVTLPKYLKN